MDFMTMANIASGVGGMLGRIFGGKRNPADAASPYINQIPGATNPYYQPWIDQGNNISPQLTNRYQQMFQNPNQVVDEIGKGYTQSPGYQFAFDEAMRAGKNSGAAGGMSHTPEEMRYLQETGEGLAAKDYNSYMDTAMNVLGMGLSGGENTANRGYDASRGYADIVKQNLSDRGGLAASSAAIKNQQGANQWRNIFGGAAQTMPWLFGENRPTWQDANSFWGGR